MKDKFQSLFNDLSIDETDIVQDGEFETEIPVQVIMYKTNEEGVWVVDEDRSYDYTALEQSNG